MHFLTNGIHVSTSREKVLEKTVKQLEQENTILRHKRDRLCMRTVGKSSEKVSPTQLDFLMNNLDEQGKPKVLFIANGQSAWEIYALSMRM